jgi:hypothetical protein
MVVSFVLVFAWIAVIVALQVRGIDAPDFRPNAERVLVALSSGSAAIEELYDQSSPRFQEVVRKDRFVDDMLDMNATVGKFVEIAAVNDSLVTTGPSGRIGRVSLTVTYQKGTAKASVSDQANTRGDRLVDYFDSPGLCNRVGRNGERFAAYKDTDNHRTCDVRDAAEHILRSRPGAAVRSGTPRLRVPETGTRGRFIQIRRASLASRLSPDHQRLR